MSIAPWLADAWMQLVARRAAKRFPHAVLVAGPAGLGKREFVAALASALLCSAPRGDGHACGHCRDCIWMTAGSHPDRIVVTFGLRDDGQPRTEIVVDQIRELSARVAMRPHAGGSQVVTIDPADQLNPNAANALLKTLEEPAADTLIVLVADEPTRLPATIRSRCQQVEARFPDRAQALAWLAGQGVDATEAGDALTLAAGNPGAALEFCRGDPGELVRAVAADLVELLRGRAHPSEVASRWAKDRAGQRVAIAAQLARTVAWPAAGFAMPVAATELARLTAGSDFPKLSAWWDRANRVRAQLRTPLRADLILLELLRDWRALAPAAKRA
jgi:DNA polymerase-3 subunit delta'